MTASKWKYLIKFILTRWVKWNDWSSNRHFHSKQSCALKWGMVEVIILLITKWMGRYKIKENIIITIVFWHQPSHNLVRRWFMSTSSCEGLCWRHRKLGQTHSYGCYDLKLLLDGLWRLAAVLPLCLSQPFDESSPPTDFLQESLAVRFMATLKAPTVKLNF